MKPDDAQLLAYVSGELPAAERDAVETAMRTSSDVAAQVACLRASLKLPLREAFEAQKLPSVPDSLTQVIKRLAREAAAKPAAATTTSCNPVSRAANDPALAATEGGATTTPIRSWLRFVPTWLAVAFVAGAFFCGSLLRSGSVGTMDVTASQFASTSAPRAWVVAAAGYQQLYSRDTLEYVDSDRDITKQTLDKIHHDDGLDVTIPDLRAAGLAFKRVQRLRFHGRPLVQIVYLPERGAPIALCVMKEMQPNQEIAKRQIDSMNVVTWRQEELGYALIGNPSDVDLTSLARDLLKQRVKPLVGEVKSPDAESLTG